MPTQPDVVESIDIAASPETVFALLSDPIELARFAVENVSNTWTGRVREPVVGATFKGGNRNGKRRWSTVCTITELDPSRCFAFEVSALGMPISIWRYTLEPAKDGVRVTESTWDRRGKLMSVLGGLISGEPERVEVNRDHMRQTLRNLKSAAE